MRTTRKRHLREVRNTSLTPNMDTYREVKTLVRQGEFQWQAPHLEQAEVIVNERTPQEHWFTEQWAWDVLTLFAKALGTKRRN